MFTTERDLQLAERVQLQIRRRREAVERGGSTVAPEARPTGRVSADQRNAASFATVPLRCTCTRSAVHSGGPGRRFRDWSSTHVRPRRSDQSQTRLTVLLPGPPTPESPVFVDSPVTTCV